MNNLKVRLYKEDHDVKFDRVFLEEETYAKAIESLVLLCADTLIVNKNKRLVYLAHRKHKPQQGWWFLGGRIFTGETEQSSAARCVERETVKSFPPEMFELVSINRYFFKDREQEPKNTPSDSLSFTFILNIEDAATIQDMARHLNKDEYNVDLGIVAFDKEKLSSEKVHTAIIDIYDMLFGT